MQRYNFMSRNTLKKPILFTLSLIILLKIPVRRLIKNFDLTVQAIIKGTPLIPNYKVERNTSKNVFELIDFDLASSLININ